MKKLKLIKKHLKNTKERFLAISNTDNVSIVLRLNDSDELDLIVDNWLCVTDLNKVIKSAVRLASIKVN